MLQPHKRVCENCRCRPASFDDSLCPTCAKALYADEDEPDRYRNEDERLDSEVHDQCVGGKFK